MDDTRRRLQLRWNVAPRLAHTAIDSRHRGALVPLDADPATLRAAVGVER